MSSPNSCCSSQAGISKSPSLKPGTTVSSIVVIVSSVAIGLIFVPSSLGFTAFYVNVHAVAARVKHFLFAALLFVPDDVGTNPANANQLVFTDNRAVWNISKHLF